MCVCVFPGHSTILFFNVQGLNPLTVASKVPYIKDYPFENEKLFIGLMETWLWDHFEGELQIDGYNIFQSDRSNKIR